MINTGSEPIVPDIPGLADSSHLVSSTDLIQKDHLPERLVIVGGGYLGLEFASIYRHFGTQVTVLETADRLLTREDEDIAEVATGHPRRGRNPDRHRTPTSWTYATASATSTVVYEKDGQTLTLEADAILAATGRKPATADLDLEAAGVRTTPRGAIEVDEHLRTSQPHIFALGDVNGGPQFTYVSLDDARIVLDQLLGDGKRTRTDRVAVPRTLFMTPPLATAGLTETRGARQGQNIKVSRENVADIIAMPRAYTVEETRGVMKFIVDADTDLILGAALLSHRRAGDHQHDHPRDAPRHHRHRTARLDLHAPQLHRGLQRGLRQAAMSANRSSNSPRASPTPPSASAASSPTPSPASPPHSPSPSSQAARPPTRSCERCIRISPPITPPFP